MYLLESLTALTDPKLGDIVKYACIDFFEKKLDKSESSGHSVALKSEIKETTEFVSEVSLLRCFSGTIVDIRCKALSLYLSDKTLS